MKVAEVAKKEDIMPTSTEQEVQEMRRAYLAMLVGNINYVNKSDAEFIRSFSSEFGKEDAVRVITEDEMQSLRKVELKAV